MTETQKKPFDSSICFTFFGSWAETIEGLESDTDKKSPAYQLYKAISNYSLYGLEPDFNSLEPQIKLVMQSFWKTLSSDIDQSKARRKRGFAAEKPTESQDAVIRECIKRPNASIRDVAEVTGVSKSSVERIKKLFAKQIQEGIESLRKNEFSCPAPSEEEPYTEEFDGSDLPW